MAITQITRSENEIIRDLRENLLENVGVRADNPSSTSYNLEQSVSREVSSMWDRMNDVLRQSFLTTAYGSGLDEFGIWLQEPRANVKRALDLSTTNLRFYLDTTFASNITNLCNRYLNNVDKEALFDAGVLDDINTPTSLTFPANIVVSTQDGISFTTNNDITISNDQLEDYTPFIANSSGSNYNVGVGLINTHRLGQLYPQLNKIAEAIKVRNKFAINNGSDIENDENYRFRLSNKIISNVTGNETAIRQAVLSVPGIVDLSLVPRSHGNGTMTIFPRSQDPIISDGLMNAVIASVASISSYGSVAYVEAPEYLAVSMRLELRFGPEANVDTIYGSARLVVMDYINNLPLGGEIIINEIVQRVMSVDDKILDMSIPAFGYGIWNRNDGYMENYTPLRLLNQVADWNQKFYTNASLCSICQSGEI